jgi:hypothetical protein
MGYIPREAERHCVRRNGRHRELLGIELQCTPPGPVILYPFELMRMLSSQPMWYILTCKT